MSKIRIGNQTSRAASPVILPFEYAILKGFDAFEWFPDKDGPGTGWEEKDIDTGTRNWIRRCRVEYDIRISVHAPLLSGGLHPDPLRAFGDSLTLFEDIGAYLFNIHFQPEQNSHDYLDTIKPLILYMQTKGGMLAIENVPSTSPEDINMFFSLLKHAKMPVRHVGLCLDLGHANLYNGTRNDYVSYLHGIHADVPVVHLHVHENYGDADTHLPLFSGPAGNDESGILKLVEWLKERNFEGTAILEQWPSPPELLDRARTKLLSMFERQGHTQN